MVDPIVPFDIEKGCKFVSAYKLIKTSYITQ